MQRRELAKVLPERTLQGFPQRLFSWLYRPAALAMELSILPLSYSLGYEMPIPSPKVPLELHMLRKNWWAGSYFEWTP